jgi:hypothetical protein
MTENNIPQLKVKQEKHKLMYVKMMKSLWYIKIIFNTQFCKCYNHCIIHSQNLDERKC